MKIHVVMQFDSNDCGVACASSICAHYGKEISLSRLRSMMGTETYGTTVKGLVKGLEGIGFNVRAVSTPKESIAAGDYTMPAIARMILPEGLAHYVVLYEVKGGTVTLMDPAERRPVKKPLSEFLEQFDGILVLMLPTEKFQEIRSDRNMRRIKFTDIVKPHWMLFATAIVFSVLISFFGIVMADFNRELIDHLIPNKDASALIAAGGILLVVTLSYLLFYGLRAYLVMVVSQRIEKGLSFGYFRHIFRLPVEFFATRKTGDVITRFQDSGVVRNILTSATMSVGIDVSMAAIVGFYLYTVSHQLFYVSVGIVVMNAVLIYLFKEPYRRINHRSMEQNSRLNSRLIDYLAGVETVKSTASESQIMDTVEKEYLKVLGVERTQSNLTNLQNTLSMGLVLLGNLAVLVAGGLLVIDNAITVGTLIAFVTLTAYFIDPVQELVNMQLKLQEVRISILRLSEVYDAKEEDEGKDVHPLDGDIEEVALEDVTFAYGRRDPTLTGLSIRIGKGEKVALVGRSGCGKTTVTKLMLKMYVPDSGRILYNGEELSGIDSTDIRRRIGYVPQAVHTFSGSLRENLLLGKEGITDEELDRVCRLTGCDAFIKRLPAGYDSHLDDRGGGLSGGEKQRLAIARAVIGNPSFLIFDEATSNMDYLTERLTYDLMFKELGNVPMLIVAHRLSTIRRCDRIYVLDDGKVAESGTHEELLLNGGLYAEMWEKQVGVS